MLQILQTIIKQLHLRERKAKGVSKAQGCPRAIWSLLLDTTASIFPYDLYRAMSTAIYHRYAFRKESMPCDGVLLNISIWPYKQ